MTTNFPESVPSTREIMSVWTECGGLEVRGWIENFARAILAKFAGLPVVMGRGNVAVGTCKRAEDGIPGIIYLAIPEAREHGTDCADVYPVGSPAPRDKVLACIQFETPQVLQQSIDVLNEIQQLHYPVAESAPPSLLKLMPEVIATLRAEGMSVNLVNKLEVAMAAQPARADREAFETKLLILIDAGIQSAFREAEDEIGAGDIFDEVVDTIRADGIIGRAALSIPPMEGDALDAKRYRGWRDAAVSNNTAFARAVKEALPPEAREGKPRWPTADEWSAAIDSAIAAAVKGGGE